MYVINDIADTKNILIHYPDSICFINIDSTLENIQWLNFVLSFNTDQVLSTIFLGIMSHNNRSKDKELFLLNADIPAGFISTAVNHDELTSTLDQILELNGAKGRRKYIRADCSHDPFVYAKFAVANKTYEVKIKDISSVGFSVDIPIEFESQVKANLVVRNCTIKLHDTYFIEPVTVIIAKPDNTIMHVVFVFLKGMSLTNKVLIRSYIRKLLQDKLIEITKGLPKDTTNYSVKQELPLGASCPFLISSFEERVEELEPFDEADLTVTNLF